jgi:type VI secretion system protein ImpM
VRAARLRAAPATESPAAGYFGKLPDRGDFVSARIDRPSRERLDDWLQRSLVECRRALGERATAAVAALPSWRFVLDAGLCGGAPATGLMTGSRDRVGRAFPLVLLQPVPGHAGPLAALRRQDAWFEAAEALSREAVDGGLDLEAFEAAALGLPAAVPVLLPEPASEAAARSFWWSGDGRRFACTDLPDPALFPERFLAADAGANEPVAASPRPAAIEPVRRLALRSRGASHAGTRLRLNADAILADARPDICALADGIGEARSAAQAAAYGLGRLSRIPAEATLRDLVAGAKGALGGANALMRAGAGEAAGGEPPPGASVVALLAAAGHFAVLWAGDARAYLLRDGTMRCLTRDHVELGLQRRLLRHLGAAAGFSPDVASEPLLPGDRLLLCSAPLTRILPERAVAERLIAVPPETAARALVEDALVAGAVDNVSALVAEVVPA